MMIGLIIMRENQVIMSKSQVSMWFAVVNKKWIRNKYDEWTHNYEKKSGNYVHWG
jgi:hypothetical protein